MPHMLEICESVEATVVVDKVVDSAESPFALVDACSKFGPLEKLQSELMQAKELCANPGPCSDIEVSTGNLPSDRPCADIEVSTCAVESSLGSLSEQMEMTAHELIAASQRAAIFLAELDSRDENDSLKYSIDTRLSKPVTGEPNVTNLERKLLVNSTEESSIDALLSELSDARRVAEEAKRELSDVRFAMQNEIDELKRQHYCKTPTTRCGVGRANEKVHLDKEWSIPTEVTAAITEDSFEEDLWQQEFFGNVEEREHSLEEVSRDLSFGTFRNDGKKSKEDEIPCEPCAFGLILRFFQANKLTKKNALM